MATAKIADWLIALDHLTSAVEELVNHFDFTDEHIVKARILVNLSMKEAKEAVRKIEAEREREPK